MGMANYSATTSLVSITSETCGTDLLNFEKLNDTMSPKSGNTTKQASPDHQNKPRGLASGSYPLESTRGSLRIHRRENRVLKPLVNGDHVLENEVQSRRSCGRQAITSFEHHMRLHQ
jgi:hypothetical protein